MIYHGYYKVDIRELGDTIKFQLSTDYVGYSQTFSAPKVAFSPEPDWLGADGELDIQVESLIGHGVGPALPDPKEPWYEPPPPPYNSMEQFWTEANKFHRTSEPLNAYSRAVAAIDKALGGELSSLRSKLASDDQPELQPARNTLQAIVGEPDAAGVDTKAAIRAVGDALPDDLRANGNMVEITLTDTKQIWTFKLFYSLARGIAKNQLNVS